MAGTAKDCERPTLTVHGVVDLRGQPAAGPHDGVVSRLDAQIPVIRQVPLWVGARWSRADEHD